MIAQVGVWRIFGPLTGQALLNNGLLEYSPDSVSLVFHLCTLGAVITLPIYDILLKLVHYYYRHSLTAAFFHDGRDVDVVDVARCIYVPNLLLGACVNDYRKPEEQKLLCDFTLTPLFLGCTRTGFFATDAHASLSYLMAVSAAAPDTFMLTKFDILPIRFLLSVLSLRFGDFVRLEPDGPVAVQVGSAVRRFGETHHQRLRLQDSQRTGQVAQRFAQQALDRAVVACPFFLCHLLLVIGQHFDSGSHCEAYDLLLQVASLGFLLLLVLSFFAFASPLRWLMRSPIVLQFQMMTMHRHQAAKPPPYLYLSDGGLIECLGVLMLLRRRVPLIICTDACEDADVTLRALHDSMVLALEERLCSFYDMDDPRRDVQLTMSELKHSKSPFLHLGIRYEPRLLASTGDIEAADGELFYIRMRLPPGDDALERPLLSYEELMESPQRPEGSGFADATYGSDKNSVHTALGGSQTDQTLPSRALLEASSTLLGPRRRDIDGASCHGQCFLGQCGGRRFPDFGTGNQFLQPWHFANLCGLGAEMSLPVARMVKRSLRENVRDT